MNSLRKPDWIKKQLFNHTKENNIKKIINKSSLHTVCQEAKCPNIGECFANKTATFLLLGNICTRSCKFCNISIKKDKLSLDENEPARIAKTVKELGLRFVVLTSVTRDDLPDGGASIFIQTVKEIKKMDNDIKIEVLVPDFQGNLDSVYSILESDISVFSHNLETVKRLYPLIREKSDYNRSINILKFAKENSKNILIKTGIMVGLGETIQEIKALIRDFYNIGGEALTIGQYLSPGLNFYPVKTYLKQELFIEIANFARKTGIKKVISSPFTRSSYLAENFFLNEI